MSRAPDPVDDRAGGADGEGGDARESPRWSVVDLERLRVEPELTIAVLRANGPRRPVPIWVVTVGGHAYVRTWQRRDTGWYGAALRSRRARIGVPGLDADVVIVDVGAGPDALRARIDQAFQEKYGAAGTTDMVTDDAAAATLRLDPAPPADR